MGFTLIKVGDKERPAAAEDILSIREMVKAAKADKKLSIITHYAVSFTEIETYQEYTLVWQLGDKDYPATDEDFEDLQTELEAAKAEGRPVVTHHSVSVKPVRLGTF